MSCGAQTWRRDANSDLKMSATAVQREYLRNAQKAIRVASAVKFNVGAYNAQVAWAESYWSNYLRSSKVVRFQERLNHLKELLAVKNTAGALRYLEHEARY